MEKAKHWKDLRSTAGTTMRLAEGVDPPPPPAAAAVSEGDALMNAHFDIQHPCAKSCHRTSTERTRSRDDDRGALPPNNNDGDIANEAHTTGKDPPSPPFAVHGGRQPRIYYSL